VKFLCKTLTVIALSSAALWAMPNQDKKANPRLPWLGFDENHNVTVYVYLFMSDKCPHCPMAVQFLADLQRRHSWLQAVTLEISQPNHLGNLALYRSLASKAGKANEVGTTVETAPVPTFFYCDAMYRGWTSSKENNDAIETALVRWHAYYQDHQNELTEYTR